MKGVREVPALSGSGCQLPSHADLRMHCTHTHFISDKASSADLCACNHAHLSIEKVIARMLTRGYTYFIKGKYQPLQTIYERDAGQPITQLYDSPRLLCSPLKNDF